MMLITADSTDFTQDNTYVTCDATQFPVLKPVVPMVTKFFRPEILTPAGTPYISRPVSIPSSTKIWWP